MRKGPEQYTFNPTENGGIGAYPERETKNRKKRKAGIAAYHAESEAEVLEKIFDEIDVAHFGHSSLIWFYSAQRPQRRGESILY
jgi:hypothetical protein